MAFEQKYELEVYKPTGAMVDEKGDMRHDPRKFYFAPRGYARVVPFSRAFDSEELAWGAAREYASRNKDMCCSAAGTEGLH